MSAILLLRCVLKIKPAGKPHVSDANDIQDLFQWHTHYPSVKVTAAPAIKVHCLAGCTRIHVQEQKGRSERSVMKAATKSPHDTQFRRGVRLRCFCSGDYADAVKTAKTLLIASH